MKRVFQFFLILFLTGNIYSQFNQVFIDSLIKELPKTGEDSNRVKLLNKISYTYPYVNPTEGLKYGKWGLELAAKLNWQKGVAEAYKSIGANYANLAEYPKALTYEYKALVLFEKLKDIKGQAEIYRNIGVVLHTSDNQQKALEYDFQALRLFQQLNNKEGMANMYGNMANVHWSLAYQEEDKSEFHFGKLVEYNLKSIQLYKEINDVEGIARITGNLANFYAINGEFSKGMVYYFEAIRLYQSIGNKNGVIRNIGNIGETFLDIARSDEKDITPDSIIPRGKTANLNKAIEYLDKAISEAKTLQQTEYYLAFGEVLSDAYVLSGNYVDAFNIYKEYVEVKDSVYDRRKLDEATRKTLDYQYGKREDSLAFQQEITNVKLSEEKKLRNEEKIFYGVSLALVLIFSAFMYNRWRLTQRQKKIIEKEKKRSDELLLNILPEEVADELKAKGSADAKLIDEATVLFTDFKGFTQLSEQLSPQELVAQINECFSAFDLIMQKHGVEKIKTIGDAYMAAGGLPTANATHPKDVVNAALDIQYFMQQHKEKSLAAGKLFFEIRIGIHTGPVVAGIVGIKKFAYDIWGDTVNTASRMESSGEVGKVNISGTTYEMVKDMYRCTHRGKVQAKGKGEIDMYFVERT